MASNTTVRLCYNHYGTRYYITCKKNDKFAHSMKEIMKLIATTNQLNFYRWLYDHNNVKPNQIIGETLDEQDEGKEILVVWFNHSG